LNDSYSLLFFCPLYMCVCVLSINLRKKKTLFNLFEFMTCITGLTSKSIIKVFKPDPVVDPPQGSRVLPGSTSIFFINQNDVILVKKINSQ